jgi:hypothetical protein
VAIYHLIRQGEYPGQPVAVRPLPRPIAPGCEIADERTGEIHDYTRKGGVESAEHRFAGRCARVGDRPGGKLWNAAEQAETRKDARPWRASSRWPCRPSFPPPSGARLARGLRQATLADRARVRGWTCAIHAPGRDGDDRNHHAHILLHHPQASEAEGLTEKTREAGRPEKAGRKRSDDLDAVRSEVRRR